MNDEAVYRTAPATPGPLKKTLLLCDLMHKLYCSEVHFFKINKTSAVCETIMY